MCTMITQGLSKFIISNKSFKVLKGIANRIIYIFPLRSVDYNLRHHTDFSVNCFYNHFRLNRLGYSVLKTWNVVPPELKNSNDV